MPWKPGAREERRSYLEDQYPLWVRANRLRNSDSRQLRDKAAGFSHQPLISVLLPINEGGAPLLTRAVDSMLAQVYPRWELLVGHNETPTDAVETLLSRYETLDNRVKVLSGPEAGKGAASDPALSQAAGEFIVFLGQNDELAPESIYEVVLLLQEHPEADLVYADSDEIDDSGHRLNPDFKPGWSPELLLCTDYISHPAFFKRELLEEIGGLREGFGRERDYDLTLRFTEKTGEVYHVPKVLYHGRISADSLDTGAEKESHRALSGALERRGVVGRVEAGLISGVFRVRPAIEDHPLVSVIIPTRENVALLKNCIDSIERLTIHSNYELLIVDNDSSDPETLAYLSSTPHKVLRFREEFNYSRINNFAARRTEGEYLLFLNDDTEVISGGWMEAMLEQAQGPDIGAVGAKLLYPDGLIQHAGVVLGAGNFWTPGVAAHSCQYYPSNYTGHVETTTNTTRNYGAVTAACMMLRRSVFEEVRGFEEILSVAFNDVDLCLRLRESGYRIVYTPHAELYHYESFSRGFQRRAEENLYMRRRWAEALDDDPYYNPNFSRGAGDFNLRADMLLPRPLRSALEGSVESTGNPPSPLEEMSQEEREAYLGAVRKQTRASGRTAIVTGKTTKPVKAPTSVERERGVEAGRLERDLWSVRVGLKTGKPRPEQLIWMFGSPRTGSTWISTVMDEMDDQSRWNEPHVGLLFGSFLYEKFGEGSGLHNSPAFIMGEPHRKAWLNSIKNFVLDGAAARYPRLKTAQYIVIKEPNGALGAPLMMEAMPESRMIFLLRDPRDVISSWIDAFAEGSWNRQTRDYDTAEKLHAHTKLLAERYLKVVSQVQKAYEAHTGNKALVRYEDLRRDTFDTMRAMYRALAVEVDGSLLREAVEKHAWESIPEREKGVGKFYRKAKPGGWREDLSPEQIKIVETVTEPVLSRFYPHG